MTDSSSRRALLIWSAALLASFAGAALLLTNVTREGTGTSISLLIAMDVLATVGVVVASRRRHPIGWIYLTGGSLAILGTLASGLISFAAHSGAALPALDWIWWGRAVFTVVPLLVVIPLPLLLFPDGKLPSRRWRHVFKAAIVTVIMIGASPAFMPGRFGEHGPTNPLGIPGAKPLLQAANSIGLFILGLVVVAAIASLFIRYRRASASQREQLKWLAWAGVWTIFFLFMAGPGTYGGVLPDPVIRLLSPVVPHLFSIAISLIPLSMAVAILRYRLWDIDRIVSRAVSYATVTALLGGTFAVLVLGPGIIVGRGGHVPNYVVAGATLIVAALFQPLRRRVQRRVDRRFNRARYDAERTVEGFTARLRQQIDLDALGAELRTVVTQAIQPSHVSVWVRPGS